MAEAALSSPELEAQLEALHDASYGWSRSCCRGDPDDAADLLQSCYVKVFSGAAMFSGRSTVRSWFFGVIRLTSLERYRRHARALTLHSAYDELSEPEAPDVGLLRAEQQQTLREALLMLPERQREIIHLVFYQGLTVTEAADVMEVSVGSARVHYDRGKKRLRLLLAAYAVGSHDVTTHAPPSAEDGHAPGSAGGHT